MQRGFGYQNRRNAGFSPASLFLGGTVQGAWYDPSDLTTLFQDSAGTTPVTAVEQPVGLMLDKSGRGNHAFQTTSASRPTLRARYNQLLYTEDFSNAQWVTGVGGTGVSATKTPNFGIAPDGTQTACRVQLNKGAGATDSDFARMFQSSTVSNSVRKIWIRTNDNSTKTFRLAAGGGNITVTGTWSQVSDVASTASLQVLLQGTTSADADFLVWHPELVQSSAVNLPYQRIGAATDYATGAAFPPYLAFDGVDDSMLTNSVDFATVTSDGQARRNLLSVPTLFNDTTGWAVARAAIAVSTAVSPPAGISNLFKLTEDTTASNTHQFLSFSDTTVVNGTRYVSSIYARAAERSWIALQEGQGVTATAYFDLATGAVGTISGTGSPTASIENIGSGWYRCSVSWVASGTAARVRVYLATGDNGAVYTGDGTSGVYLSAAQLETGSTATAFQNIGTDKMLVVAGVTKQSDAGRGMLLEIGPATTPRFAIEAPTSAAANYGIVSGGTVLDSVGTSNSYAAPLTNVLTGTGNIAAPSVQLRVNGVLAASASATQGTGNYGNYPLYIGRRNNASLPFNGSLFSLIIAGQSYAAGQITSTEQWVAARTPLGSI